MYTHPFFEATPPGAAPGPPVNTGARVRHFRGCNQAPFDSSHKGELSAHSGVAWFADGARVVTKPTFL